MKGLLFIWLLLLPLFIEAQVITTIAGTGILGFSGDGTLATIAKINTPSGVALDLYGNFFISDASKRIRKVSDLGIITTIAGSGTSGYSGDGGMATSASIDFPGNVAVDKNGSVYFTCNFLGCIRKVTTSGIISTYAGSATIGYGGDGGPATAALLNNPLGLRFDSNDNLYFTDGGNQRIRRISSTGIITTIAGNGINGYNGDGIIATNAKIYNPHGVAVDKLGNVYVADQNNYRIRKISPTGIISTIAGNGTNGYSGDGGAATDAEINPWDIVVDEYGNLFFSDYLSNIRKVDVSGVVSTIAGNGIMGYYGDNGSAALAQLDHPYGLNLDTCGNIFIADALNNRIRKITYPHCHYLSVENESIQSMDISIYPNPANETLTITNVHPNATYQLCNIVGFVVQYGGLRQRSNTISIAQVPLGMYLLALTDEQGRRTVHKVVKE